MNNDRFGIKVPYMKNLGNPSSNDEGVGCGKQSSCIRDEASKLKNKGA